jgi:cytochrome c biogenesis protein CcdA/thiol-disulfide isomerase/thioredoxin
MLPIILSSTISDKKTSKSRPLGVVSGFVLSFTFFTLFLSSLVRLSGISADSLRLLSIIIIAGFGFTLLIPQFQSLVEKFFSKFAQYLPQSQNKTGFSGGLIIGLSIGLLWTPCVGPILASVISLAITGTVTLQAVLITLAYALGTAIPMFLIMLGGQKALKRVPWLVSHLNLIQRLFGVVMILTALALYFNLDRQFQTAVLNAFPQYGAGLTQIEDNQLIKNELEKTTEADDQSDTKMLDLRNTLQSKGTIAPELISGGSWLNSVPLTLESLKGKVVLLDFWTYSCINCQRTLPYLKSWYEKYQDQGLVIIGIHSPEFEFEKSESNVKKAIDDFGITYPVMQDNDFATWRAYRNRYWPAKYFIDANGFVRHTHFGEGEYDESEAVIQALLKEAGAQDLNNEINNPSYQINSRTPELYLGYGRIEALASPESIRRDQIQSYSSPSKIENNQFAYEGDWLVSEEYANPQVGSRLHLNFDAKEAFLVMRSKAGPAKVIVFLDDKLEHFGEDNDNGIVTVDADTLYKLINLPESDRHQLRLEFEDSNVEVFAFTFG